MLEIPEEVRRIANSLHQAGGKCFLVGGFVRDFYLGIESKDIDIEIHNLEPSKVYRVLRKFGKVNLIGESFGVYSIKGINVDWSIPRKEESTGKGHKDFYVSVDPYLGIDKALERRDFTINAMAISMKDWFLIDLFNGKQDLKSKKLCHVSDKKFVEDPLRVFRGIQFCARFDLEASVKTRTLCRSMVESYYSLPKERIWEELKKFLLKGKYMEKGIRFLRQTNWIQHWPELNTCFYCPQDLRHHPEGNVGVHTIEVLDHAAKMREEINDEDKLPFMLACLLHDIGKPSTTAGKPDGSITSYKHDKAGESLSSTFLERLTNETNLINEVGTLIRKHMWPHYCLEAKATAFRKLKKEIDPYLLGKVCEADGLTTECKDYYYHMLKEVGEVAPVKSNKTVVQGRHLILYGLRPSPQFGEIIQQCENLFLETGERQPHVLLRKVMKNYENI